MLLKIEICLHALKTMCIHSSCNSSNTIISFFYSYLIFSPSWPSNLWANLPTHNTKCVKSDQNYYSFLFFGQFILVFLRSAFVRYILAEALRGQVFTLCLICRQADFKKLPSPIKADLELNFLSWRKYLLYSLY